MLTVDARFASWAHPESPSPWTVTVVRDDSPRAPHGGTGWTVVVAYVAGDGTPVAYRTEDGAGIYGPAMGPDPDSRAMLATALSFLSADADRYRRVMGPITDPHEDGYLFGVDVAEWAYGESEDLNYAHLIITDGDAS